MLKSSRLFLSLFFIATLVTGVVAETPPLPELKAVEQLDVGRYMGQWYEVAKYPNRFQQHCVGDTTANYLLQAGGVLRVVNRCRSASGVVDEAIAQGRQLGGRLSARFEVRFAPSWLSLLPFVWSDYWVIDIDPNYQLAAVSGPRREYLWILSRTPQVDATAYAALLKRMEAMGFDIQRLEKTPQHGAVR